MSTERPKPVKIDVDRRESVVRISWKDGHESSYSFMLLRAACPCASCRGGHENMSSEPDEAAFTKQLPEGPAIQVASVEAAGAYGISFHWADGHHFGIYNWHYLKALCPCETCRPQG